MLGLKKMNKKLTGSSKFYKLRKESILDSLDFMRQVTKQILLGQKFPPKFISKKKLKIETSLSEQSTLTARQKQSILLTVKVLKSARDIITENSEHNPFRNNQLIQEDVIAEDVGFIEEAEEGGHEEEHNHEPEESPGREENETNRMPVVDGQNSEGEEEQEVAEPGMQYQFISRELMFTAGNDGQNILGGFARESHFGESTIVQNDETHVRETEDRRALDVDVTPDEEDDREEVLDQ